MLTISPEFRSTISGTTARVTRTMPVRLTSRIFVQSSAGPRAKLVRPPTSWPALLMRMSIGRKADGIDFEKLVHPRVVRHIELRGMREGAKRPSKLGHGLVVNVRECNVRAAFHERCCYCLSDSASGARHQSFASAQRRHRHDLPKPVGRAARDLFQPRTPIQFREKLITVISSPCLCIDRGAVDLQAQKMKGRSAIWGPRQAAQ